MSLSAELYAPNETDHEWLENLGKTAPGRALKDHFMCVDHALRNKNRAECPIQQVADFRRILCAGLTESDRSFGLPRPLPKYLAVVNMSGFRALLYSSRSALVRLLCLVGPESSQKTISNVEAVLQHAASTNMSVMVCLSMPWQAGVCASHWEVRTLEKKEDGTIRDGRLCYSASQETVRCVACSIETDVMRKDVMRAQIQAFTKHFSACNLDLVPEVGDASSSDVSDERMAKLSSIVSAVRADRERLLGELTAMKDDHTKAMTEADRASDERVGKVAAAAMQSETACRNRIVETDKHNQTLIEQNMALGKAKAEAQRSLAEHELFQEQVLNREKSKASVQEMSAKSATDKLTLLQKSSAREREQLENAHARIVSDLERRLQTEQMKGRKTQTQLDDIHMALGRLGEVCDQLRTEKQALTYDSISLRKRLVGYKCAVAISSRKHASYTEYHKDCVEKMGNEAVGLIAGQHELQQMLAQAEGAAHAAEMQVELLTQELSETNSKPEKKNGKKKSSPPKSFLPNGDEAAVAPAKKERKDTEAQTNGETAMEQKLSHDIGQLSTEFANLSEQLEKVTKERDDLSEQLATASDSVDTGVVVVQSPPSAAASPPPNDGGTVSANGGGTVQQRVYNQVYNQVVMPGNGYMQQPPLDLGSDAGGDLGLETLIGQMQGTMRTLVDYARQGSQHKHVADNMWSELQAMKRFTGTDGSIQCGWQQPYYEMPIHSQQWAMPAPTSAAPPTRNGHSGRRGGGGWKP